MKKEDVCHQKISKDGQEYAVLPYAVFLDLINEATARANPEDLARLNLQEGRILVSEWRKCLNLSQETVADRLGIPVFALEMLEKSGAKLRKTTIAQLAATLDLTPIKVAA